ncbi:MAG TPA: hypothetical protein VIT65_08500 [Microlunatus sp.]
MDKRRSPWLVASALLIGAGLTGAAATYLWWLPCRGQMLLGTPLGSASVGDPGQACIDRMGEGTPFPLPTQAALSAPGLLVLATVTIVLVSVAWLLLVFAQPVSRVRQVIAALPALGAAVVAVLGVGIAYGMAGAEGLAYPLDTFVNLLVVVAVVVLWGHVAARARFLVMALALSSMGFAGPVAEYMVMVWWSELNWDAPPGSGYLTAALLLVCGITVLMMTVIARPSPVVPPEVLAEAGV